MENADRRVDDERTRIEAEYRELLKNALAFEKRIRNRWREKNRQKNARISKLEARIEELEREVRLLKGDRTQG